MSVRPAPRAGGDHASLHHEPRRDGTAGRPHRAPRRGARAGRLRPAVGVWQRDPDAGGSAGAAARAVLHDQGAGQGCRARARHRVSRHTWPVDLFLTDVVLRQPSGRTFAEEPERRRPGVPVPFRSGRTDDESLCRGMRTAGLAFPEEPFTARWLLAAVRERIQGRGDKVRAGARSHHASRRAVRRLDTVLRPNAAFRPASGQSGCGPLHDRDASASVRSSCVTGAGRHGARLGHARRSRRDASHRTARRDTGGSCPHAGCGPSRSLGR